MTSCGCRKCMIGPSILNADLSCLAKECNKLLECGVDYLHLDVMDGYAHDGGKSRKVFAFKWVDDMADAGADQYTFHIEAIDRPLELIQQIKKTGMKVGVGVKPNIPVESILPFVDLVGMVLIMTVKPGFGGQKFMADMMPKIKHLRTKYKILDIEVDGGVGIQTIEAAAQAGAKMIVSGSAVLKSDKPKEVIDTLWEVTDGKVDKNQQ